MIISTRPILILQRTTAISARATANSRVATDHRSSGPYDARRRVRGVDRVRRSAIARVRHTTRGRQWEDFCLFHPERDGKGEWHTPPVFLLWVTLRLVLEICATMAEELGS